MAPAPRLRHPPTLALVLLGLAGPVAAQEPQVRDTTARRDSVIPTRLPDIDVTVTRTTEPLSRVPQAVGVLNQRDIRRAQLTVGLDEALTNVPGVYVANRYNFSLDQRISIRGFGSRSNFGVRGVKVLLDGVPQTLPDGQGQLTNVELGNIERVEVLRGSSSSLYGNASGGVIQLQSEAAGPERFGQLVRFEFGEFGTDKWQIRSAARSGPLSGTLSLSRFTTTGFRQNSAADFRQVNVGGQYLLSGSTIATLRFAAADDPRAQNPGALTYNEYLVNPDSAAANNINRRADKDVQQQQLAVGVRHIDAEGNEIGGTVFGLLRDLANPLATNTYVAIDRKAGGVRVDGSWRPGSDPWVPKLTGGVDVQRLRDDRQNFLAAAGQPTDSVQLDQLETVTELGPFVQAAWTPVPRVLASAGVRYDRVAFDLEDRHFTDGADNSGNRTMAAWSGHAGVSYEVSEALVPYVNVSTSFETPTTTELVNQPDGTGGFNTSLDPQRAVNYELGARGRMGTHVTYTVSGFLGRVRDAIVQFEEVGGRAFFRNAGKTHNNGLELGLTVSPIPQLRVFGTYTFSDYTFDEYTPVVDGVPIDLAGNRLAGVPRHFTRIGLRAEPGYGVAVDVDQTISSSITADDRNRVWVPGWGAGVTNLRLSWSRDFGQTNVAPFFALNNVWDRQYISSVTINGVCGNPNNINTCRVVEPAPGRFVYVGAEIGFRTRE